MSVKKIMNSKILIIFLVVFSIFIFNNKIYAASDNDINLMDIKIDSKEYIENQDININFKIESKYQIKSIYMSFMNPNNSESSQIEFIGDKDNLENVSTYTNIKEYILKTKLPQNIEHSNYQLTFLMIKDIYENVLYLDNNTPELLEGINLDFSVVDLQGWVLIENKYERFYVDNNPLVGVQKIGNTSYLFDKNGNKQKGWHVIDGNAYYFSPEHGGGLLTGMRTIDKTTYLLTYEGKKTGWHVINGNAYYFSPKHGGGRITGMRNIDGTVYLLTSTGKKTGWHIIDGNAYYFSQLNGGRLTGIQKIGQNTYLLTENGKAYGWHLINGKKYYFNEKLNGVLTHIVN